MPSTATTRNRLEKQATGENTNTWGSKLNATAFDLIDTALDGRTNFTLSGSKTLSSANFAADEARGRFLDITSGTGGTVTIPAVEKWYIVRNATSGNVVLTTGGATTATVPTGQIQVVVTDGSKVYTDTTVTAAAASAAAAAASAASINDANLVHKTGAETVAGLKTFSDGIAINGQTLSGLSAAGKAVAEAANASAQLTALGVSTFMKTLLDDPDPATARATIGAGTATVVPASGNTAFSTTTPASINGTLSTGTMVTGGVYRVTVRGIYTSSSTSAGLGLALVKTGTLTVVGYWRAWTSASAYSEGAIDDPANTRSFGNAGVVSALTFEVQIIVTGITTATLELKANTTNVAGTITVSGTGTTMVVERLA